MESERQRLVRMKRIGQGPEGGGGPGGSSGAWTFVIIIIGILAVLGLVAFVLHFVYRPQYVRTITGVGPTNGEVTVVAGTFISVSPNPVTSTIFIHNTGVGTINSLTAINNNIVIAAGSGVAVANNAGTATITISNTGVLTVNSAPPQAGDIKILGGTGITVNTNVGTGEITIVNDGVLTVNNAPPQSGDIKILAGMAIDVSTNVGTGEITVANTGVKSLTPNYGIESNVGPTGDVDVFHSLSYRTSLAATNPLGPQVSYFMFFGFFLPAPENTWRCGPLPGYSSSFFPGVTPGEDGVGNGGFGWTVPEVGEYTVNGHCVVFPSARVADDHQSHTVVVNLGGSTADPTVSGYIPPGGRTSLDISGGGTDIPLVPLGIPFSVKFHAGCTDCPVAVGAALSLHVRHDHTGVGGPVTFGVSCRFQVTESKRGVP